MRLTDKLSLVKYANNKKISDNLRDRFPHPYTLEDAEWFINFVLAVDNPITHFVIEVDEEAAGIISLTPDVDVYRLNAEMGYWLAERYWGKGIMTAVIKETVQFAFSNLKIRRIYATPFSTSIGSVKVLEKAGFIREACIEKGLIKNNKLTDYYIYSINNF